MHELKRGFSIIIISWCFWSVALWIIFTFLAQQPISKWETAVRIAFIFLIAVGFLPSLGIAAIVESTIADDERRERIANGEIVEVKMYQDPYGN